MAVHFMDGFDNYAGRERPGLYSRYLHTGNENNYVTTGVGRYGVGRCILMADGSGTRGALRHQFDTPMPGTQFCVNFGYFNNIPSQIGTQSIFWLYAGTLTSPTEMLSIYQVGFKFAIYRGATQIAITAADVILANQWNYVEWFGHCLDTNGFFELWVNGVQVITFTGDTMSVTAAAITCFQFACPDGTNSNNFVQYDDLIIFDQAVRHGERRIETIRPSADTAVKSGVPSAGTSNSAMLNEIGMSIANYVDFGAGQFDMYDFSDVTATGGSIDAVCVYMLGRKTDVGDRSIASVLETNGQQTQGANRTLIVEDVLLSRIVSIAPDGEFWTAEKVNGLKAGMRVTV